MKKYQKIWGMVIVLLVAIVVLVGWYLHRHSVPVLQPAGEVGSKERNLMLFTVLISTVVVVPVFLMLGMFAWRYREGNKKSKYSPDLEGNRLAETVWWAIPTLIIGTISIITWRSSYALDPFRHLSSSKPVLHVQVVALDWKWLFIYPNQDVASVNEAAIPVNTPVDFEITSDAVMTSFWVPQLGGQMYAMPGMSTNLNLMASRTGSFFGSPANISGKGFADMDFKVKSMSDANFSAWIANAKHSTNDLTDTNYIALARPSIKDPVAYYSSVWPQLYNLVVLSYMNQGNAAGTVHGSTEAAL